MELSSQNQQFMQLYRACEKDLFRYILSLAPQHVDALDILQETASDLWQKFDRYDASRPFAVWARRFAHLRVLKHRQQAKARKRDVVLLGDGVTELLAAERELHEGVLELRRNALMTCIEKLTEAERELLKCRYWTDQKLKDLAQKLGEPEQRLYHRLASIRKVLQECINKTLPASEGI